MNLNNRKILIAGMGRTGTHLMFHIVKRVSRHRNLVKHCHFWDQQKKNWADIIISTKRDTREQMASTKRYLNKLGHGDFSQSLGIKQPKQNTIYEEVAITMKIYNDWEPYTKLILPLEEWYVDPKNYIIQIFNVLGVQNDGLVDRLSVEFQNSVLPKRLPTHITKDSGKIINYRDTLTDNEIAELYRYFNDNPNIDRNKFLYIENYANPKKIKK